MGAANPEDYGDYFAWGETEPYYSSQSPLTWKSGKSGYNWASYSLANGAKNKLTKYCPTEKTDYWDGSGNPDNILVLQSADDAAYAASSGKFRMPTNEEWKALLETSDFTWARVTNFNGSGKNGRLVISRKSGVVGNCIFLPAAGFRTYSSLDGTGSYGYYWSSSLDTGNPYGAYKLYFNPDHASWTNAERFYGQSVRPVQAME